MHRNDAFIAITVATANKLKDAQAAELEMRGKMANGEQWV